LQSTSQNFFTFGENAVFDGLEEYTKPRNKKIGPVMAKNRFLTNFNVEGQKLDFDLTPYFPLDITDFRGKPVVNVSFYSGRMRQFQT